MYIVSLQPKQSTSFYQTFYQQWIHLKNLSQVLHSAESHSVLSYQGKYYSVLSLTIISDRLHLTLYSGIQN